MMRREARSSHVEKKHEARGKKERRSVWLRALGHLDIPSAFVLKALWLSPRRLESTDTWYRPSDPGRLIAAGRPGTYRRAEAACRRNDRPPSRWPWSNLPTSLKSTTRSFPAARDRTSRSRHSSIP